MANFGRSLKVSLLLPESASSIPHCHQQNLHERHPTCPQGRVWTWLISHTDHAKCIEVCEPDPKPPALGDHIGWRWYFRKRFRNRNPLRNHIIHFRYFQWCHMSWCWRRIERCHGPIQLANVRSWHRWKTKHNNYVFVIIKNSKDFELKVSVVTC